MTVDITSEDEMLPDLLLCPALYDLKSSVWNCRSIKAQTMSIKSPGLLRVVPHQLRAGYLFIGTSLERGIGFPEARGPSIIRQTRVNAHTGTSSNDQGISSRDHFCGALKAGYVLLR